MKFLPAALLLAAAATPTLAADPPPAFAKPPAFCPNCGHPLTQQVSTAQATPAPAAFRTETRQVCDSSGTCRTVQVRVPVAAAAATPYRVTYGDQNVDPFEPGPSPTPGPGGDDLNVDPFGPDGGGGGRQRILRIFGGPGLFKSLAARRGGGGRCR